MAPATSSRDRFRPESTPREQRPVDRRGALDDDPVRRDLLARANHEHVADLEVRDRDLDLDAVAKDARIAAPSSASFLIASDARPFARSSR